MKKQIFLLPFLSLAFLFAGVNQVFGQFPYQTVPSSNPQCITPIPLADCETDPPELHPIQGVEYTYEVDQTPANATIRWFVVNNLDIDSLVSKINGILPVDNAAIDATNATGGYDVSGSEYILNVTDGASNYNSESSTNTSITMSWKYFNGLAPNEVLLVAHIWDDVACTNNIAVWRIIPTPAFTLDVAALNADGDSIAPAGSTGVADTCVSPIEFAIYNSNWGDTDPSTTPGDSLAVDYGENWLFFVVNAANYIDSWMPTFQFTYTDGNGGTAIPGFEASWAYLADATSTTNWNAITGTLGTTASDFISSAPVIAGATGATAGTSVSVGDGNVVGAAGECIIVRVRLDWGTDIEHDQANSTLRFAVDGVSYDGDDDATSGGGSFFNDRGYADLGNSSDSSHADNCQDDEFRNDWVDYDITPRPQIEEGTPEQEDKSGQGVN